MSSQRRATAARCNPRTTLSSADIALSVRHGLAQKLFLKRPSSQGRTTSAPRTALRLPSQIDESGCSQLSAARRDDVNCRGYRQKRADIRSIGMWRDVTAAHSRSAVDRSCLHATVRRGGIAHLQGRPLHGHAVRDKPPAGRSSPHFDTNLRICTVTDRWPGRDKQSPGSPAPLPIFLVRKMPGIHSVRRSACILPRQTGD
jgi:hypothetical protein